MFKMFKKDENIEKLKNDNEILMNNIEVISNQSIQNKIEFIKLVLALKELYDDDFLSKLMIRAEQIDPKPYFEPYMKAPQGFEINLRFFI